jgi:hypothetical protein
MGAGFTGATAVSFGTVSVANNKFIVNSDTQITAVSPAGSGTVDVTVTTPGGTSAINNDDKFTYLPVMVKITNPANNSSFGSSQSDFSHTDPITFTASASDSSGHPLTGTALQWTVDGKSLGTGESFSATLPSGCSSVPHTVKVVATDSTSGLNASDTITVYTGQVCYN